jgi:hypothetical protein
MGGELPFLNCQPAMPMLHSGHWFSEATTVDTTTIYKLAVVSKTHGPTGRRALIAVFGMRTNDRPAGRAEK